MIKTKIAKKSTDTGASNGMNNIKGKKHEKLSDLLQEIITSPQSHFYHDHFKKHGIKSTNTRWFKNITDIPLLTWDDIAQYPFKKRLYKDGQLLVKIVYRNEVPLLVARSRSDIALENYGSIPKRPLVWFNNSHDSIEKSMWLYERNSLPLINMTNASITALLAKKYKIDGLLAGNDVLPDAVSSLQKVYSTTHIKKLSVIDTRFDLSFIKSNFSHAHLEIILGLPEVGSIATACKESLSQDTPSLVFHPDTTCIVEPKEFLIVTKLMLLPTPLIRYQTTIQSQAVPVTCKCKSTMSFVVLQHHNERLH